MLLVQSVQRIARGIKQGCLSRSGVFNLQSCALGVASSGGIRNWQHWQIQIAAATSLDAFSAYGVERVSKVDK